MITKYFDIKIVFRLSICLFLCFLISCNRTNNTTQTPLIDNTTQSTGSLETTNTEEINEWLIPLISEYLQDDGNTPINPSLTVYKNGNGSGNVTSSPSGISCGSTCNSNFDANTIVTLTAVADAGSSFTSWSGCPTVSANICTVTITSSQSVTATFTSTLTYQGFYITQAAQNFNNSAALAENRKGYARLFLTQSGTAHTSIDADLHVYSGTTYLGKIDLVGLNTAPSSYGESDLTSSYNAIVPAAWIKADTNYYISIGSSISTNIIRQPSANTITQNIKAAPPLEVVWVPVIYNGQTPSMTAAAREALLKSTREYWPIVDINQTVRAGYTFNQALEGQNGGSGWLALLSQIRTLKINDGAASNVYYHAIVDNAAFASQSGIYGFAYTPGTIAVSREHTETIAHEWGHNWGRNHVAGCFNPSSPDSSYPHSGGSIGVWGINVFDNTLALKPPSIWRDTMSYCGVDWSSDYNYDAIANYRSTGANFSNDRVKQLVLMVNGSIISNGQAILNPSFSLEALSDSLNIGDYTVQLLSATNVLLAETKFDTEEIDHSDERHFFVNVPITSDILSSLTSIRILDSNGNIIAERNNSSNTALQTQQLNRAQSPVSIVEQDGLSLTLEWDNTLYPKIMVKNTKDGDVIAISDSGTAIVSTENLNDSIEVLISNGLFSSSVKLNLLE